LRRAPGPAISGGVTGAEHLVDGNRLRLLVEGQERLQALLALIGEARRSLRLLYYIFADDASGQKVRDALIAARERGVTVRLIIDGFGSDPARAFLQPLEAAGVEICEFIPRLGRRYLLRNHQKLALADEERLIVGGFNIEDSYFRDGGPDAWRDLGLELTGPAAARLAGYYDALQGWTKRPRAPMRELLRALTRWSEPSGRVRWLLGGPTRRMSPWARTVRADMYRAGRIALIAAYFAPSPTMLRRLDRTGRRGDARVITAGRSDNDTTIAAARFTYPGLLRKGVRVFEYQPARLHTKLYLVDDVVHIGSANFDVRSLFLNMELMLRIEDAGLAAALRDYFAGEQAASREWTMADFAGWRSWLARPRHALAYFLVAVVDYSVSRRLNVGTGD